MLSWMKATLLRKPMIIQERMRMQRMFDKVGIKLFSMDSTCMVFTYKPQCADDFK